MDWYWLFASTLIFIGGFVYIAWSLKAGTYHRSPANLIIMGAGFICQSMFLYYRGEAAGRCPITNQYEILVFVGWSAVIMYFLIGRVFRLSLLGAFTAPLVAFFQIVALPNLRDQPVKATEVDYWLEMHASVSLLAYGAFALACIAGVMFLVQNRMLKKAQLDLLSTSLPPVTYLSDAITRLIVFGLVLLTFGILSAFGMESGASALHLGMNGAVWLAYAGLLTLKFWKGMPSVGTARAAIAVFLLPMGTLLLMPH